MQVGYEGMWGRLEAWEKELGPCMAEASGERTSGFCMIYASGGMALSMKERTWFVGAS